MVDPTKVHTDLFDLNGRKAVVSGAGRGIGKAIALGLARAGADIGLVARTESELNAVADEVKEIGRRAVVRASDLTVTADIPELISGLAGDLGGIDILVNNAGTNIPQDSVDVSEAAWDTVMAINLKSCFFMAQAVGKVMIEQGRQF